VTTIPPTAPDAALEYRAGVWTRAGVVVLVLAAALLLTAPIGWWNAGTSGILAALLAAGICLAGTLISLGLACFAVSPDHVLAHVVVGMFGRMALGLLACLAIYAQEGWPVEGGMVYFLLVYYPLALAVETHQDVAALQSLFPVPARRESRAA
jgi:hypothetical protein